jgi:hypothetical protein
MWWKKLLFVSIMLAQKFADDRPLPSKEFRSLWHNLEGSNIELNQIELDILKILDWNASVTQDTFDQFTSELSELGVQVLGSKNRAALVLLR